MRWTYGDVRLYSTYILSNNSMTLYIGMTNNLRHRVFQHKTHQNEGFTDDYNATRLVYGESYDDVHKAIGREKQLKGWRREKKMRLVETTNPRWQELAAGWYETQGPSTAAPVHFVNERPRSG